MVDPFQVNAMMNAPVAHVVGAERDGQGRVRAMTMINRGDRGVLVWSGRITSMAEGKLPEQIEAADYVPRETVSLMSWRDAEEYFEGTANASLVHALVSQCKRSESVDADSQSG